MFGIFRAILEVYIIIRHAVYQQQITVKLVSTGESRRLLVSFRIFFRCTHEAFRINRVVETPVGWCGNSYTCLEYGGTLTHAHQSHVSTVAPSPNTDAIFIYIRLFA